MKEHWTILAINPGSITTKIALFRDEDSLFEETIEHSDEPLERFPRIADQCDFRKREILDILARYEISLKELDAIVCRGGLLKPMEAGTYRINEVMIKELQEASYGEHASNLAALITQQLLKDIGEIPIFIVDPPVVDEFEPIARISGTPLIERKSRWHVLNARSRAKRAASELGGSYEKMNFIVAHLGGGISVSAHRRGRTIDVNNALLGDGPFSPQRAGTLPIGDLIELCFSGKWTREELLRRFSIEGGLTDYLGTDNGREVEERIARGDKKAELIYQAMAYQIAKTIGEMATVLRGEVDAIVLTGGLARSALLVKWIEERVSFIAEVKVYPGQEEMRALVEGALEVLRGLKEAKIYK